MNEKLRKYLDGVFSPYEDLSAVKELKEELYNDLLEKLNDLRNEGYDEEAAYNIAIDSLGDVSEIIESINAQTRELQQRVGMNFSDAHIRHGHFRHHHFRHHKMNFSMSPLRDSDFKEAKLAGGKFDYCELKGSDFSNSDLSESSFKCSNLDSANFNGANLTGVKINKSHLRGASFQGSILDKTVFTGSDLSGVSFDGQRFNGTVFDYTGLKGTSFKNAVFTNVSFKTNVKRAVFDGATMDKSTYALLKGYKAKLDNVTVI